MIGLRFNKLVVLHEAGRNKIGGMRWLCLCDCGTEFVTDAASLRAGRTKSCGCLTRFGGQARMRNGEEHHPLYRLWMGMKSRCENQNNKKYHIYGGKGISVCERWMTFHNFIADMGERPLGTSLDRIDGRLGYSKDNCRWATPKTQANNKESNRVLKARGKSMTVAQWSSEVGIKANTIICRLRRGWSEVDAISKPVDTRYWDGRAVRHQD